MNQTRNWSGFWIRGTADPAPWLRKAFELETIPQNAVTHLCGLGWHELYVNGTKADDRVLRLLFRNLTDGSPISIMTLRIC